MTQIREEVSFTKGRVIVRGKLVTRGKAKRADYILYYKPNIPIAVIEAKDNNHSVGDGMQQALEYAETLESLSSSPPTATRFCSTTAPARVTRRKQNSPLDDFPSPAELWARYRAWKGLDAHAGRGRPSGLSSTTAAARSRVTTSASPSMPTIEAIAKGQNRILLVMATGTGKTYTAFQIIWRLWKAGARSASSSSPTAISSSIRPWSTTSGRSGRQWRSSAPAPRQSSVKTAASIDLPTCRRQEASDRHRLRNLSLRCTGDHRSGGAAELFAALARFLRSHRHRRVPSRQRRRGFRLARDSRILLRRDADRSHRHAEGNRSTSPTSITSATPFTPIRSSRASAMVSSLRTRW